jgi:hypothetical protein
MTALGGIHDGAGDHDSYTKSVDEGSWPASPRVPLPSPFVDARGGIQNVLLRPCRSVAFITSTHGSVRANHYHRTDWHYAFVVRGRVLYFEREIGATEIPKPRIFITGECFFTPPMREHAMLFDTDTEIVTMAKNARDHESHESDVVRVEFVTPEVATRFTGPSSRSLR